MPSGKRVHGHGFRLVAPLLLALWLPMEQAQAQETLLPGAAETERGPATAASYFVGYADGYAASRGFRLTADAQEELFSRIAANSGTDLLTNAEARLVAKTAAAQIVDRMIVASEQVSNAEGPADFVPLDRNLLLAAFEDLCPVWPFC